MKRKIKKTIIISLSVGLLFLFSACSGRKPENGSPGSPPDTKEIDERMTMLSEIENNYYNVMDFGAAGDGMTDDTEAVSEAIRKAFPRNGTVFFPAGEYLISETITVKRMDSKRFSLKGGGDAKIIGSETLDGVMFHILMYDRFQMTGLSLEHRGQGSIVDAVNVSADHCEFTASEANNAPLFQFHGPYCAVTNNKFHTTNPEVYAIEYCSQELVSINNTILDNEFTGTGKGILVGNGEYTEYGRCEGLKIGGNIFRNTGSSQITIQEVMQVNISENTMTGGSENAILIHTVGYGTNGIFIRNNIISAREACIRVDNSAYLFNVSNNVFESGKYGIHAAYIKAGFIRDNIFRHQITNSIHIENSEDLIYTIIQ